MNRIKKRWRKWFAIPLAVVLVAGTVLTVQLSREPEEVYASNVAVTNTELTGQVASTHTFVQFDMSWNYSWRDSVNRDAVWVFVKYRVDSGSWAHATLSSTSGDHTVPAGFTVEAVSDGTGVLIYRSGLTSGTSTLTGVQLRWNYAVDGVADGALVEGKVFAIEMVYIPQDSFWVGDTDNSPTNSFRSGNTTNPLQITSEGEITVDDTNATSLYWTGGTFANIPTAFPKGYNDFYVMKYEVSQRQYAEFLNCLETIQSTARFIGSTGTNRQTIELQGSQYGSDGNANNALNESDDGEWIAANFLAWADAAAYADWAGLRPMTELEFEKAARGNQAVVNDEYAWGTTNIVQQTQGGDWSMNTEYPTPANSNANYGNVASPQGPMRVGSFTDADDTREEAGASYYGVMELSGNLWETVVSVGNSNGRAFTGTHGDGAIDATTGNANVSNWPLNSGTDVGTGLRGGNWAIGATNLRIADRTEGIFDIDIRFKDIGFRAVRTAP